MSNNEEIGKRIRLLREDWNMSQSELSKKLGYKGKASVQKIESGLAKAPYEKIKMIADLFGTTPEWILGHDTGESPVLDYENTLYQALNMLQQLQKGDITEKDRLLMHYTHQLSDAQYDKLIEFVRKLVEVKKVEREADQLRKEVEKL
jgi:transcriptional regulator with XRE-family HTH domain